MLNQPSIKSVLTSHTNNRHTLTIEPLMPGYGYTIGNSMRRIMLSSIPGFAVTRVRINDITHEYQSLDGVVEDALDIVLNIKSLKIEIVTDDEEVSIVLKTNKAGSITADDFQKNSKVRISNPDLYICTTNESIELNIEVVVSRGVGYLSVDQIDFNNSNPQEIVVDALFSPVSDVSLEVEKVRVGENTNYDRTSIHFYTDGTVDPQKIVDTCLSILIDLFQKINSSLLTGKEELLVAPQVNYSELKQADSKQLENSPTEDTINLPKTILKILDKNNIVTFTQLIDRKDEIKDFPGITEAHIKKINKLLS